MVKRLVKKWQIYLIEYGSAVLLATVCGYVRKYVMIIVTAISGSLVMFYSLGFGIGVLGNFFDVIERIKSGKPLVI